MSSHCRYLRTGIMTGGAKLLIAYECAAVAEGRHRSERRHTQTTNIDNTKSRLLAGVVETHIGILCVKKIFGTVFEF